METLILLTYSFIIWLLVKKFKIIPWNIVSQVIIFAIPIIFLTIIVLIMNYIMPITNEVKVTNRVVAMNPMVRGRVISIPVEPLTHVEKGDTLFQLDATPYETEVEKLQVKIISAEANLVARNYELQSVKKQSDAILAQLTLAETRRDEYAALAEKNAGSVFDLEKAVQDVAQLKASLEANQNAERRILATLTTTYEGNQVSVAELYTMLEKAEWNLEQTTVVAPSDGMVVNMQLRVGSIAVPFPITAAMNFVEDEQKVIGTFLQNELMRVEKGDEVEMSIKAHPGKVFKGKVHEIIWAQGEGQFVPKNKLPNTSDLVKGGKYVVVFDFGDEKFPMGANGMGVIYTEQLEPFSVIRKVFVRIDSKLNYIIPKLH